MIFVIPTRVDRAWERAFEALSHLFGTTVGPDGQPLSDQVAYSHDLARIMMYGLGDDDEGSLLVGSYHDASYLQDALVLRASVFANPALAQLRDDVQAAIRAHLAEVGAKSEPQP